MVSSLSELRRKLCSILTLGCLLCGLSVAQEQEIQARTSYVPGVNFSRYRTYRWVEVKGQQPDSTLDAQIKQAIDSHLAAKGLTETDDATADLNVDYQTAISRVTKWETYEDWTNTGLPGQPGRETQQKQVTIEVGTLVLDMYDATAKQLVWTGRAHKTLEPDSSPKDRRKNIDKAATALLADFPPK